VASRSSGERERGPARCGQFERQLAERGVGIELRVELPDHRGRRDRQIVFDRRRERDERRRHLLALRGGGREIHDRRPIGHRLDREHRGPHGPEALPVDEVDRDLHRLGHLEGEPSRAAGRIEGRAGERLAADRDGRGLEILVGPILDRHLRAHQQGERFRPGRPGLGRIRPGLGGAAGVGGGRDLERHRRDLRLRDHLHGAEPGAGIAAPHAE
jgi:hypothetical protein